MWIFFHARWVAKKFFNAAKTCLCFPLSNTTDMNKKIKKKNSAYFKNLNTEKLKKKHKTTE